MAGGQTQLTVEYLPELNHTRTAHQMMVVSQDKYVVTGGHVEGFALTQVAEFYDSSTKSWTTGTTLYTHDTGFLAKLNDGRYLIGGGSSSPWGVGQTATTEIYNPADDSFTQSASMAVARAQCRAASLKDGRVMVVGNWYAPSTQVEIYDPQTDTFSATGKTSVERSQAVIIPTNDGGAIIGGTFDNYGHILSDCVFEKYDPETNDITQMDVGFFDGKWILYSSTSPNISEEQLLPDGRYLLLIANQDYSEEKLIAVDPETCEFAEIETQTPIMTKEDPESGLNFGTARLPLIDRERQLVHIIQSGGELPNLTMRVQTIDLRSGLVYAALLDSIDVHFGTSSINMLPDGRILFAGGNKPDNFKMSSKAFIISVILENEVQPPPSEIELFWKTYPVGFTTGYFNNIAPHPDGGYMGVVDANQWADKNKTVLLRFTEMGDTIWTRTYYSPSELSNSWPLTIVKALDNSGFLILYEDFKRLSIEDRRYNSVMKIDNNADSLWRKQITPDWAWSNAALRLMHATKDKGYVLPGASPNSRDLYVLKLDKDANTEWGYSGSYSFWGHTFYNVCEGAENSYFAVGHLNLNLDQTEESRSRTCKSIVVKLNSEGQQLWLKTFNSGITTVGDSIKSEAFDVVPTEDGGCIVGGHKTHPGVLSSDGPAYLIRLDKDGEIVWEKSFFPNFGLTKVRRLLKLSEDKYIAEIIKHSGFTNAINVRMCFDSQGDTLWTQQFTDNREMYLNSIAKDGGLFLIGSYNNKITFAKSAHDGTLFGPELWAPWQNQTNVSAPVEFKWRYIRDQFYKNFQIQIAKDENFEQIAIDDSSADVLAFVSSNFESNTEYYWRVRLIGPDGGKGFWSNVLKFTTGTITGLDKLDTKQMNVVVFSNPATASTRMCIYLERPCKVEGMIYNTMGVRVDRFEKDLLQGENFIEINTRHLAANLYTYIVRIGDKTASGKFVVTGNR